MSTSTRQTATNIHLQLLDYEFGAAHVFLWWTFESMTFGKFCTDTDVYVRITFLISALKICVYCFTVLVQGNI